MLRPPALLNNISITFTTHDARVQCSYIIRVNRLLSLLLDRFVRALYFNHWTIGLSEIIELKSRTTDSPIQYSWMLHVCILLVFTTDLASRLCPIESESISKLSNLLVTNSNWHQTIYNQTVSKIFYFGWLTFSWLTIFDTKCHYKYKHF